MLRVSYKDDEGEGPTAQNLSSDFPAGVAELIIDANFNDCSSEFAEVSNILNQETGKLQRIHISGIHHITPEFLVFFIMMSRKARELSLREVLLSEGVCTSVMAAIMNPDGLTGLQIRNTDSLGHSFSAHQIGLFFEGISSSPSLEHFSMISYSQYSMDTCSLIARSLRRNRSLKSFKLLGGTFPNSVFLQSIVSAALFGARLETLELMDPFNGEHHLTLSMLVEGLCRENCKLKTIDLSFEIAVDMDLRNIAAENSSLLILRLGYANLSCAQFVDFASLFSSLQVLDIGNSPISELTPLGVLLLNEASGLQRLNLGLDGGVDDDEWLAFCEMIPRMKSLRSFGIDHRVSFSVCTGALLEGLWQNTSLEHFRVFCRIIPYKDMVRDDPGKFFSRISVPLSFNRAGRRALQNRPSEQPLKQELWPLVLERATKLSYYSADDKWKSPSLSSRRSDAVYWLLRETLFVY